jgi:ABC-type thiamin/hydroxymethylpyrimidine transport system permease subunit
MLEKYYKKLKITNQVVFLITVVLIVSFFVKINMNVFLIPNAQNLSLNTPFLAYILIGVLFLNGLIARIIFIKERQKKDVYQED